MVSIILTTYKRPVYMVLRAIKSILSQTYEDIELIIVDDSPSDYALRDEVKKAINDIEDKRIIYIQNEKNVGACASRNRGIRLSKGDFIMYVDDDDELTEDSVEKKLKKFVSPKIGLVYSDCFVYKVKENLKKRTYQKKCKGYVFDSLILENYVYAFPLIRRECFDVCGFFDEQMQALQDYEMWLRIAKKYEFDYVDEPLAIVYIHPDERISTNPEKKIQAMRECMK